MSIDDTAQTMFGMGRLNPMTILQVIREVKTILDMFSAKKGQGAAASDFSFTGQHTDIAFVAEQGSLNASVIESIPDEQLRNNVTLSFSDAVKDGYLDFDTKTKNFTLTEKGTEHINSDAFKAQFEKDQLREMSADKARVEFKGNAADLNVFRFTDSISLNHLSHSDPAAFKRVQDYFLECEKYGFVTVSSDGIVTPTDKCREYLNRNTLKDFDIQKVTPDNIRRVAGELADKTFENALDKAETGIGMAQKSVSFLKGDTSGSELAVDAAKLAAQKAAKDAAAKKAAEQAVKKAAAKAAAKTGAKGAVSSTGYGAVVVAAIKLTAKGANALTKMDTQSHKVMMNR